MKYLTLICLALALSGCATDNARPGDASEQASRGTADYRTGSRLPTYEPAGASSAREVSKDDWNDDRRLGGNMGNTR
jgi:hypothetical protein